MAENPICCRLDSICEEHILKAVGEKNFKDGDTIELVNIGNVQQGIKSQFDLFKNGLVPEENLLLAIKWMARNGHILINGEPPIYLIADK